MFMLTKKYGKALSLAMIMAMTFSLYAMPAAAHDDHEEHDKFVTADKSDETLPTTATMVEHLKEQGILASFVDGLTSMELEALYTKLRDENIVSFQSSATSHDVLDDSVTLTTQSKMINYLAEQGIPFSYLFDKKPQEIEVLYKNLYGKNIVSFDVDTSIGVENTIDGEIEPQGEIPGNRLSYTLTKIGTLDVITGEEDPNEISRIFVMVDYEWASGYPFLKYNDAVTVNWEYDAFVFMPPLL